MRVVLSLSDLRGLACPIIILLILAAMGSASAQEAKPKPKPDENRIESLVKELKKKEAAQLAPEIVPSEFLDEEAKAAMQQSLTAYYDYRTSGFDHRRRVFAWQLFSSKVIFVIVIFLVGVGLYFSWLQFRASMAGGGNGTDASIQTTIEASAKGLKVSSPVLGVIILTLSLAFFYLYLVYVYPIEEIF